MPIQSRPQFDRASMTARELLMLDALETIYQLASTPYFNAERKHRIAGIANNTMAQAKYNPEYYAEAARKDNAE